MMRKTTLLPLALAFPVLGLAGLWANSHNQAQKGKIWEVNVSGYDPRDLLRGHYIRFRYEWPTAQGDYADALCLTGVAPTIVKAVPLTDSGRCDQIVRLNSWADSDNDGINSGQLYVAQTKARALEKQLADSTQQAIVTVRIRADGKVTPLSMRFRLRTKNEMATENGDRPPAPASIQ